MALSEWGLTPEYINSHWTEELFGLMVEKRAEKLNLMAERLQGARRSDAPVGRAAIGNYNYVSQDEFMRRHGIKVNEVPLA